MTDKDNTEKPLATFINVVKITEVKGFDYIVHFQNTFSGEAFVFKVYKELFDKAMEIRDIDELKITTREEIISGIKKGKKVRSDGGLYA